MSVSADATDPLQSPSARSHSSAKDNREDVEPQKCAVLITNYPLYVCCGCWVIIIFTLIMSAQVFDIAQQASREFIVEDDQYVIRQDALRLAGESAVAAATASVVEVPNSKIDGVFSWTVYFRNPNTDWILTKSNIDNIIMKYEGKIVDPTDYSRFCFAPGAPTGNYACMGRQIPGSSLAWQIKSHPNYTTWTDNDIKAYVRSLADNPAMAATVLPSLNKEYNTTGRAWFYRSFIFMGGPIPTGNVTSMTHRTSKFANRRDRASQQRLEYNKYATPIWQSITTFNQGRLSENGIQIVAVSFGPLIDEFGILILQSSAFALGSMMFVLFYLWFHLQSFFLACSGMTQILMAFPTAYFLYYYIYNIKYFGFLSYLIIFVLLGLGADDIFVLIDAFHQSEHIVKNPDNLEERMSYTYRRAAKAMLVTQITTFFAFLATSASVLMPISAFGYWAATLVATNYLLVISLYVCALILWYKYVRHWERFGCCCSCCCPRTVCCPRGCCIDQCCCEPPRAQLEREAAATATSTQAQAEKAESPPASLTRQKSVEDVMHEYRKMERFFGEWWVQKVNKYKLFLLAFFVILFGVGGYGASQLTPQTEDEQFFPEDHYFNFLFLIWPNEFFQGENDVIRTATFYWGISGVDRTGNDRFDTENYGKVVYDTSFDMSSVGGQQFMRYACSFLRNSNLMFQNLPTVAERVDCFMDDAENRVGFANWLTSQNLSYPYVAANPANQKQEFNRKLFEYMQLFPVLGTPAVDVRNTTNGFVVNYVLYKCKTSLPFFPNPTQVKNLLAQWEDLRTQVHDLCVGWGNATGVCNPSFLDDGGQFTRLATADAFVSSAVNGIAIALPLAFVILILSTHNLIIAFMSVLDIGGVVMTELAIMAALGWQLGIAESVALIMMIGFSVDYVVHFGHAYVECPFPGRMERLKYSLLTMGISVVSGGITTFGAGFFLSFPIFIFFRKIGLLLMTTIVNSLIWALLFYTSLLALWGPEGSFGRVPLEKVFFCCPWAFSDHMMEDEKHQEKRGGLDRVANQSMDPIGNSVR